MACTHFVRRDENISTSARSRVDDEMRDCLLLYSYSSLSMPKLNGISCFGAQFWLYTLTAKIGAFEPKLTPEASSVTLRRRTDGLSTSWRSKAEGSGGGRQGNGGEFVGVSGTKVRRPGNCTEVSCSYPFSASHPLSIGIPSFEPGLMVCQPSLQ